MAEVSPDDDVVAVEYCASCGCGVAEGEGGWCSICGAPLCPLCAEVGEGVCDGCYF